MTSYKIIDNRCVLSFNESNDLFCRALADSKLFGGITITPTFTQASFYAKKVCSLRELLSQRREKLQYIEGVKMAQCLGQQLFYLEKYAHTFKKFSGEIKEKKIVISPKLLENNISIQKTAIMSATPINTENLDITEMMQNK